MKYLELTGTDPYWNLAAEEYLLRNGSADEILLLWQNRPSVILGRYQNLYEEVHTERAEEAGVPIARRESGGGAVYHDEGNLNFSFIVDAKPPENRTMERFTRPVAEALRSLGVPAEINGRNDIEINGLKVSGSAQTMAGGRMLHHGTLLFSADLDRAQYFLKPDAEKFRSKGVASVRGRIGNIREYMPPDRRGWTVKDLKAFLRNRFAEEEDGIHLSGEEKEQISLLADRKYRSPQWMQEESGDFDFRNSRRTGGGRLTVEIKVREQRVLKIRFRGDFLSIRPVEELERKLEGLPYRKKEIGECLQGAELEMYFGSISGEAILDCIFDC